MKSQKSTAILFLHGILESPAFFDPFLPLVPGDWTVCRLLLQGHCGTVQDFSRASMAVWAGQVKEALTALRQKHDRVIIAAHSMGTLFAIQEASEKSADCLFLLNVPLKPRITCRLLMTVWKVFTGSINPDDAWTAAARDAFSIEPDRHLFRYLFWIPRYLELFSEIAKTRKCIRSLTTLSYVYQSVSDEMVSPKSCRCFKDHPHIMLTMLEHSGHFYYAPCDRQLLYEDFRKMVKRFS